jgi:hypothetical protein
MLRYALRQSRRAPGAGCFQPPDFFGPNSIN